MELIIAFLFAIIANLFGMPTYFNIFFCLIIFLFGLIRMKSTSTKDNDSIEGINSCIGLVVIDLFIIGLICSHHIYLYIRYSEPF